MRNSGFFNTGKFKWVLLVAAIAVASTVTLRVTAIPEDNDSEESDMKFNKLTPEEERVIIDKGTEAPYSGIYYEFEETGTYTCKRCGAPLYHSANKFDAQCGWPSFDDEIPGAVKRTLDADGVRTEITCARCGAHLGHVFEGEGFTEKNVRHCVNSISLNFVPDEESAMSGESTATGKAYFAGGCFWGTEHLFKQLDGVISTRVGYMGGDKKNPTYEEVCSDNTGYAEAVEVVYDPSKTDFEKVAKYFFEIHDPTQVDRQGPDIGSQYRSVVFYLNEDQKKTTEKLIKILEDKGYDIATEVVAADSFWEAEDYHQDYYDVTGKAPYCHAYTKRF
jgi:peptide methionine sulfoxide reductase msrA/msrB